MKASLSCQHLANILENNHEEFKGNTPEELAKRLKDNNISLCDKCEVDDEGLFIKKRIHSQTTKDLTDPYVVDFFFDQGVV